MDFARSGSSFILCAPPFFYTAYLNRDYLQRSQEPEMFASFYYGDGCGYRYGNIGIGPARVEWFQILVDDDPQPNFGMMFIID